MTGIEAVQTRADALLVDALARLEVMERLIGDPAGRHPSHQDLAQQQIWVKFLHSDTPDWDYLDDPLDAECERLDGPVQARVDVLLARIEREREAYDARVAARTSQTTESHLIRGSD